MKKVVLSAALAIVSGAAFAQMTAVEDEVLSAQTGQDGISIALNVKAHIDSFEWIDTDAAGGSVAFENIAIGSGALTATAVTGSSMTGINMATIGAGNTVFFADRNDYANSIAFGGPINIDVEDVAAFSGLAAAATASPSAAAQAAGGTVDATDNRLILGSGGYSARVPAAGTKAVVIGLPRMVMSFNVGAIKAVGTAATAESFSMGGIRMTNIDFSSTKVAIWGHK